MNPAGTEPSPDPPGLPPPPKAALLLPEDVVILYAWANIPGASYRDFSAAREERRRRRADAEAQPAPPPANAASGAPPAPPPEFSGYRTVYRPAATLNARPRSVPANELEPLQSDNQAGESGPAWLYGRSTRDRREPSADPAGLPAPAPKAALSRREKEQ